MADTLTPLYAFTQPEVGASTDTWGGKLDTDLLTIEQEIARLRVPFLTPAVAATTTLDFNQTSGARIFAFTVSQATTLAFTNVPSNAWHVRALLKITNGAAFALTFPGSVVWHGGSAPTFSASGVDWVEMFTIDGGVTWYAHAAHQTTVPASSVAVRRLWTSGKLTTAVQGEASLATFAVPANTLIKAGDTLRIQVYGTMTGVSGGFALVRIKFGSVTEYLTAALGSGAIFKAEIVISRAALNSQAAVIEDNLTAATRVTSAETETNAITVDVRAGTGAGASGTLIIDNVTVEYIPSSN